MPSPRADAASEMLRKTSRGPHKADAAEIRSGTVCSQCAHWKGGERDQPARCNHWKTNTLPNDTSSAFKATAGPNDW